MKFWTIPRRWEVVGDHKGPWMLLKTLEFCALHEVDYMGSKFTWCNFHEGRKFIKGEV
jgi:hypothetical protein